MTSHIIYKTSIKNFTTQSTCCIIYYRNSYARLKISHLPCDGLCEFRVGSDVFDENSPVIDIIGQKFSKVVEIAKDLCKRFDQNCVLVKDCRNEQIYLVEQH